MTDKQIALVLLSLLTLGVGCKRDQDHGKPQPIIASNCGTAVGYVPCPSELNGKTVTPDYLLGLDFTDQQWGCLSKLPAEHDGCRTPIRAVSRTPGRPPVLTGPPISSTQLLPARRRSAFQPPPADQLFGLVGWLDPPAARASEEAVTFHNPGVGGLNGSVKVFFREAVFFQNNQDPVYDQHAHGRSHSLYVVDRKGGPGPATVTLYPLEFGDVIQVHLGPVTGNISEPSPYSSIELLESTDPPFVNGSCVHEGMKGKFYKWRVRMNSSQQFTTPTIEPDVFAIPSGEAGYETRRYLADPNKQPGKYIRRLVVRAANGQLRYDLPLSSCGAFQTCARPEDGTCNDVPLCRIDIEKMIGSCEACKAKVGPK